MTKRKIVGNGVHGYKWITGIAAAATPIFDTSKKGMTKTGRIHSSSFVGDARWFDACKSQGWLRFPSPARPFERTDGLTDGGAPVYLSSSMPMQIHFDAM